MFSDTCTYHAQKNQEIWEVYAILFQIDVFNEDNGIYLIFPTPHSFEG